MSLINDILRVSNFNGTKWSDLGLSLRLHPNKIKEIEESQPTHHRRLLECLTLWLESQDTLPQFLVDALKDNNETTAAENIRKLSMLNEVAREPAAGNRKIILKVPANVLCG